MLTTPAGSMEYTIKRRSRVTRRLHMELDELGGLVVVAPRHWPQSYIDAALSQNTSRIERFLVRARQWQLEPFQYVGGELHFYLGERYPLHISLGAERKTTLSFSGEEIRIQTGTNDSGHIRHALNEWYKRRGQEILRARLQIVGARAAWVRDRQVPFRLRKMKRTWGNCSSKGVIKLNTHLIKAPLVLIDAVIAHELCHLREMNHGKAFYTLLEGLNPNWREDRRRLRSEGNMYLL